MPDFYRLGADEALSTLQVNRDRGLNDAEITKRRAVHGDNELPAGEGTSIFQIFIGQFQDLMVIILLVAAVISFFLGETVDAVVIMIIVVLNAALGVYQEYQAEQSLAALSAMQVPLVRVRRDGVVKQISATELVPGDIVLLEEGDKVPADGRILNSINLRIEEAALTGESMPSDKSIHALPNDNVSVGDQHNMAFMGTSISYGRGEMVVTDIGLKTQIGKIAGMLMGVEEGTTPLQKRLDQLGRTLAIGAGIIVLIVFLVGWLIQHIAPQDMFLTAISLAVAAVPEGLPALVTIGLSLGANRMVKRHALIRRLPAVETLGSVTVICSDKTGTLTKNEMTATYLALPGRADVNVTGIGYKPIGEFALHDGKKVDPLEEEEVGRFIKAMALSTNAYLEEADNSPNLLNVVGDTTEGALIIAAQKAGFTREILEDGMPRMAELPFDSDRKAMTTIHAVKSADAQDLFENTPFISITKGAPDKLLNWATSEHTPDAIEPLSDERRNAWQAQIDKMASEGLRVLGVAYRPLNEVPSTLNDSIERDLVLLGLVGILDPARPEAKEAVKIAKQAGIRTIMITGDHALTGQAIAKDLGILEGQRAVTGAELDKMSDDELSKVLDQTSAFARVSPAHKLKIVQMLQKKGNVVAMTGDGVNDAPALKQADIGVAMGITGTDVSKGAAEMVLTDDNFASIVSAVEEGRAIYDNIRKFIKYLLSSNVGEILVMFVALLMGMSIPLIAIQILWINLVTDGLPAIALGFEPAEKEVMRRKPRAVNESIFSGGLGTHIVYIGILIAILTLGGYVWGHVSNNMDPFSKTLGLEKFSRVELIALVGEEYAPVTWDTMDNEARRLAILGENNEAENAEHGASEGIVGQAERIPRTIAFTILAMTQMFEVMSIHAGDKRSFFSVFFKGNMLLLYAIISTVILQLAVIYVPFLQSAFKTEPLSLVELLLIVAVSSLILIAGEIEKVIRRGMVTQEVALAH